MTGSLQDFFATPWQTIEGKLYVICRFDMKTSILALVSTAEGGGA
jgi:hypothetical protein